MSNPLRGEVALTLDGERHIMRLTLGALVELEELIGEDSLAALVARFEGGEITSRDIMALLLCGLRGGGWDGTAETLLAAEIDGSVARAAQAAAQLIHRSFAPL